MSRKTITERVKRCKDNETRLDIIMTWLNDWEVEQVKLCDKLPLAIDIRDFDELCIVNGQLREITNKKFTALYNILRIIGLPDQAQEGGQIYSWGKYQTGLIAIMGRHIAAQKWDEIKIVADKLIKANQTSYKGVKHIITERRKLDSPAPVTINRPTATDTIKKSATVQEFIETYSKTDSLKETAKICGVNWQKVRKILITEGLYENDISIKINSMHRQGFTLDGIAQELKMSKTAVNSYLPYEKGVYNLDIPSVNAQRIRKHRAKPT